MNKHRYSESNYKMRNKIMLDFMNIHHCFKRNDHSIKFYSYYLDSYKIIEARSESSNYKLELHPAIDFESIYSVFHAKLL